MGARPPVAMTAEEGRSAADRGGQDRQKRYDQDRAQASSHGE